MKYLATLRRNFGNVFTFFAFMKPYVVVCDPFIVRRVLSDHKIYIKGKDYTSNFDVAFGQGLVTSMGEKHKKDKSIFAKYFMKGNIAKFASTINVIAKAAVKKLVTDEPLNIEDFFATLALRVFMNFSTGTDFSANPSLEKDICTMVSKGSWYVGRMITLGLPSWRIIPWVGEILTSREFILVHFRQLLEDRKKLLAR